MPAALSSYQASLAIRVRLAKFDPGNAGWQRDLTRSYAKLATVYLKARQPMKAREAFGAGHDIVAVLAVQFPDQAQWKQDLTWFDKQIAALKD
jgi:hypothetical protein